MEGDGVIGSADGAVGWDVKSLGLKEGDVEDGSHVVDGRGEGVVEGKAIEGYCDGNDDGLLAVGFVVCSVRMEGRAVGGAEVGGSVRWEEGALVSNGNGARLDGLLVVGLTLASFPTEGRVVCGAWVGVGDSILGGRVCWEEGTFDSNRDGARLLGPDNIGVAEGEKGVDIGSKDGAS